MPRPPYSFVLFAVVELLTVVSLMCLLRNSDISRDHPRSTTLHAYYQSSTNNAVPQYAVSRRSYIMALGYVEQLTSATRSFLQLFPLAADWNMHVPEPFVMKSRLFGLSDFVPLAENLTKMLPLSLLYNLSILNKFVHEKISPNTGVVPVLDFIKTASRKVIIFHYGKPPPPFSEFGGEWVTNSLARRVRDTKVTDCSVEAFEAGFSVKLENHLNRLVRSTTSEFQDEFHVAQALCFDHTVVHTSTHLRDYLVLPATVVFTNWRGCSLGNCSWHHQDNMNIIGRQMPPQTIRTAILTNSSIKETLLGATMIQFHHQHFLKQAARYLSHLHIDRPFLAVHIRTERVVRDGMKLKLGLQYSQHCIQLLEMLTGRLMTLFTLKKMIVVTDNSHTGSDSCQFEGTRCKHSHWNSLLSYLNGSHLMKHHVEYQEEEELNTHNSGYVSLVECNMLALGSKLVLVGHGAFQNMVEGAFLSLGHLTNDVYHICDDATSAKFH